MRSGAPPVSAAAAAARPPHVGSWPPQAAQASRRAARPRLLLVDDDPLTLDTVRLLLRAAGMDADVVVAHCGREALALGRCHDFDLLIVDMRLPDVDGLDVVETLGEGGRRVPFLVHTAYSTTEVETRARQLGAVAVIDKLADGDTLVEGVRIALAHHARTRQGSGAPAPRDPTSPADQWAKLVLAAATALRDLRTVAEWAREAGVSPSVLRTRCRLLGLKPQAARDLTRVLRARLQTRPSDDPTAWLEVGDDRTLHRLLARAGVTPAGWPTVHDLLDRQSFVPAGHHALRALRQRLGRRGG